jgi:hypothetical protein
MLGVPVAYNFQTANNKIELLTEYENITQQIDSTGNKKF